MKNYKHEIRDRRGRYRMAVGSPTTCAISNPAQVRCTQYNII